MIIGALLISPLMGSIVAAGLALAARLHSDHALDREHVIDREN